MEGDEDHKAVVLGFGSSLTSEGIQVPHLLPLWSLGLADAFCNASLQHRVPATAWKSSGMSQHSPYTAHTTLLSHTDVLALSCAYFWGRVNVSLIS